MREYRIDQLAVLSNAAIENDNYTEEPWFDHILRVSAVHISRDDEAMYSLRGREQGSEEINVSLYAWELRRPTPEELKAGKRLPSG